MIRYSSCHGTEGRHLVDSSPLVDLWVFLWRQIQVIYAR
jgi:hypothetical protein